MKKSDFTPEQIARLEETFVLADLPKSLNSFPRRLNRVVAVLKRDLSERQVWGFLRTASIYRRWPGEVPPFVHQLTLALEKTRMAGRSKGGKVRSESASRARDGTFKRRRSKSS